MWLSKVLAHSGEEVTQRVAPALDQVIRSNSLNYTLIALIIIVVTLVISVLVKNRSNLLKLVLFVATCLVTVANTIYLSGSTVYLNQISVTKGPVHYHADFEIYSCNQEINIKDPQGLSNKTGTEVIHEHNDKRMHIEGVLLDEHDASISHFFEELGGRMTPKSLTIPTNEGLKTLTDGDRCADGQASKMQVFVYQTRDGVVSQKRLIEPTNYIISPESNVPPGDCIIVEFSEEIKTKTDKICHSYKVARGLNKIHD